MLTLKLSSVGNPDFGQNPNRPQPGVPQQTVKVKDYAQASQACRAYIAQHNLGGGNWSGGQLYDEDGALVAQVSYNGKVWPPGEWAIDTQPLYIPW